uniref:SFRICE_033251 n=1 Tax=Spodoptera frugiperda TaxID=7108 RepID=A0A2H1WYN2_SPOFR
MLEAHIHEQQPAIHDAAMVVETVTSNVTSLAGRVTNDVTCRKSAMMRCTLSLSPVLYGGIHYHVDICILGY